MVDSNLTKKDVFNFLNLGRKIVISGAGTMLDAARSKVAELTDSEDVFGRRIEAKFKAMTSSGLSEMEARQAIAGLFKNRLNRAFEKFTKPSGDSAAEK